MHALLIALCLLGAKPAKAKPAQVEVSLADYAAEIQAIAAKADEEKAPQAVQAALAKGITQLNQKYKSSKARLTITCPIRHVASNVVTLEQAEETAGLVDVKSNELLPSHLLQGLVRGPLIKYRGGEATLTGVPYVTLDRKDSRCTVLRKGGDLYIHLSAERIRATPPAAE